MSFNHTVAPPEPLNDAALLAMFVDAGSEESLARLIQRHLPMVLGVCRRMLGNSDAEDAAQAVFVLFWQKAKQVKQHSRIAGWLHRTAHHVCRNSIRARAARIKHEQRAVVELNSMSADPSQVVQWSEIREILDSEVNRLPDKLRVPFVLFHLENRSLAEVAATVGSNVSTVGTWLQRSRERVACRLRRRGILLGATALAVLLSEHAVAETVSASLVAAFVKTATDVSTSGIAAATAYTPTTAMFVQSSSVGGVAKKVWMIFGILIVPLIGLPWPYSGFSRSCTLINPPIFHSFKVNGMKSSTSRMEVR